MEVCHHDRNIKSVLKLLIMTVGYGKLSAQDTWLTTTFHLVIISVLALEQRLILGMGRQMSCIFLSCVGLFLDGMCGNNGVTYLNSCMWVNFLCDPL
jgi:hypothetical protein